MADSRFVGAQRGNDYLVPSALGTRVAAGIAGVRRFLFSGSRAQGTGRIEPRYRAG